VYSPNPPANPNQTTSNREAGGFTLYIGPLDFEELEYRRERAQSTQEEDQRKEKQRQHDFTPAFTFLDSLTQLAQRAIADNYVKRSKNIISPTSGQVQTESTSSIRPTVYQPRPTNEQPLPQPKEYFNKLGPFDTLGQIDKDIKQISKLILKHSDTIIHHGSVHFLEPEENESFGDENLVAEIDAILKAEERDPKVNTYQNYLEYRSAMIKLAVDHFIRQERKKLSTSELITDVIDRIQKLAGDTVTGEKRDEFTASVIDAIVHSMPFPETLVKSLDRDPYLEIEDRVFNFFRDFFPLLMPAEQSTSGLTKNNEPVLHGDGSPVLLFKILLEKDDAILLKEILIGLKKYQKNGQLPQERRPRFRKLVKLPK
jgi:hypothetical protein